MTSTLAKPAPAARSLAATLTGRCFVHPLFDYLVIGGGLSLVVTAFMLLRPENESIVDAATLPWFILFANSAHFASSTVRLYTKPGTKQALPFLTLAFPLVVLAVVTICLLFAGSVAPHVNALYLTWSPYHYAAQAYGLALVYAYRSGCQVSLFDKRLLWWVSMLPFFYAVVGDSASGLHWFAPSLFTNRALDQTLTFVMPKFGYVAVGAVLLLAVKMARGASGPMPIISVMMLIANTAWWCFLPYDAFVWATIFHGIQYLGIVTIFHVKDQLARPDNRRGLLFHIATFYGGSLLLGYGLFSCLPWGFVMAGFGMAESLAVCVAAINIHHFIVDAYIWRLKKGDGNRTIVEAGPSPQLQAAPA